MPPAPPDPVPLAEFDALACRVTVPLFERHPAMARPFTVEQACDRAGRPVKALTEAMP